MNPPVTSGTTNAAGLSHVRTSGSAAPTANVPADASAAWMGRAGVHRGESQLVASVSGQSVVGHELHRDLPAPVLRQVPSSHRCRSAPAPRRLRQRRARDARVPGRPPRYQPASSLRRIRRPPSTSHRRPDRLSRQSGHRLARHSRPPLLPPGLQSKQSRRSRPERRRAASRSSRRNAVQILSA